MRETNLKKYTQQTYIVTTRFDTTTWEYNEQYRDLHEITGCLYSDQTQMSRKVPIDASVLVIEMNNSKNMIEGVGLIRNRISIDKNRMYSEINYNRFVYRGKYRIGREKLIEENLDLVETLDAVLFKGKTHMKRGTGYTRITDKIMKLERCEHIDIIDTLIKIFKKVF
jgi:hypothetical protein